LVVDGEVEVVVVVEGVVDVASGGSGDLEEIPTTLLELSVGV